VAFPVLSGSDARFGESVAAPFSAARPFFTQQPVSASGDYQNDRVLPMNSSGNALPMEILFGTQPARDGTPIEDFSCGERAAPGFGWPTSAV